MLEIKPPGGAGAGHGVQDDEQLPRAGDEGRLPRLPALHEALVEGAQRGVVAGPAHRRQVEGRPDGGAPAEEEHEGGDAAYLPALEAGLARIAEFAPDVLVVSYGADTYAGDPISHFRLQTSDYRALGARIAGLGLPTLIVMEGGYAVEALGANVASLLEGF